ncbi:DDB1- and CUL4-associated factor 1-like [Tubulanus polymorphus]|uniref:DDB1- and CUL4-associated factor 1-like n=1 Tax=Tubulanus polymorphus TaxID=672921 RepID=UPI003DA3EBC4
MSLIECLAELSNLLESWQREVSSGNVVGPLTKICELLEKETEAYYKMDPDPFDDRHPGRADPLCTLGHLLKVLFKNEEFMNKLVNVYLLSSLRDDTELVTVSCRLLLNLLPGLESSVVFNENENLTRYVLRWAETADEPLRSYATGLLPAAMEVYEIATSFRDDNSRLVPVMLRRLHELNAKDGDAKFARPFAEVCGNKTPTKINSDFVGPTTKSSPETAVTGLGPRRPSFGCLEECSNSNWAEMEPYVIGMYRLNPLTSAMKSRLIVQYLTIMGEFQELLGFMLEHNALELVFTFTDLKRNSDVRLAFEALKFLASLLCHKKFSIEFIAEGGVRRLLRVQRPSVAATGVSMCLYYLSYFEDAMERVCLLPETVLDDLVNYVLWLLECSHESGRCHATMFFSSAFHFRVILNLFDAKDGLRRLVNAVSTLQILSVDGASPQMTDDEEFTSRQSTRHVCLALKKYFEAHMAIKAEELQRNHARREGGSVPSSVPPYKAAKYTPEVFAEYMDFLSECLPSRASWPAVSHFIELDGINIILRLIALAAEWSNFNGKAEAIRCALDALAILSVLPKVQLQLCEYVLLPENHSTPAISILLGMAEGEVLSDPDVMRSAIQVIINCACGPENRHHNNVPRFITSSAVKKRLVNHGADDVVRKMWDHLRGNNGIMVILKLLMIKMPITEADSIRAMACRALAGLARDAKVKQIIGKLPLFNSGQLQSLMKEPVLQDKRVEHVKFCQYAAELIERVSGKRNPANVDASLERIRRADVVAQTMIVYQEKELLQLMYEHLLGAGYNDSATALQKEAKLVQRVVVAHPSTPKIYSGTPKFRPSPSAASASATTPGSNTSSKSVATPGTPGSIKINIINSKVQTTPGTSRRTIRSLREKDDHHNSPSSSSAATMKRAVVLQDGGATVSLDKIVTEYLRKQHALCANPVVTCPPFSLLQPHQCPVPKHRTTAPVNITPRMFRKWTTPRWGALESARYDRKFVYSRFRPVRTYRDTEEDGCLSCVAFSADDQSLIFGTYAGEVKIFNIQTAEEQTYAVCHNSPVNHCEASRDGRLVLTSASAWGNPLTAVWSYPTLEPRYALDDEEYAEFGKTPTQDRIVATKADVARIYDTATGRVVAKLHDANKANNYTRNRATFNYTDSLVLSDGIVWDVRTARAVHKFDKFNAHISGIFHPMGLEVIVNTEVWDLRTFNLLHTVPALDQNILRFNHTGDVMYGIVTQLDDEIDDDERSPMGTSFRTFDATNYASIATVDVKKSILDICTDRSDCYLAVIESQKNADALSDESVCKLYEVGRRRDSEEDVGDEEDDADLDDDEDDSADADDDDDENMDDDNEDDDNDDDGSYVTMSLSGGSDDEEEFEPSADEDDGDRYLLV